MLKGKPRGYRIPIQERFESKVNVKAPPWVCWPWLGALYRNGYGKLAAGGIGGATLLAHRVAYELYVGLIPAGSYVRHSCDNPVCVNPAHLQVGSQASNIADMWARGRGKNQLYGALGTKDGRNPNRIYDDWKRRKRNEKGQFD
jgi:hypothetical protein